MNYFNRSFNVSSTIEWWIRHKKYFLIIIFFIVFILGLELSEDYGISWDETLQRFRGQEALVYVIQKFDIFKNREIPDSLKGYSVDGSGRYGAIFDLPTAALEEIFYSEDIKDAFLFRHKLNWVISFLGIVGFFLFTKFIFQSWEKAIIATLFYMLHPRLLAHGFFNPKDSILQALVAFSLYPLARAYFDKTLGWFLLAGLAVGLCISTRIVAIYIPILFICLCGMEYLFREKNNSVLVHTLLPRITIFFMFTIIGVYSTWPILWENSIHNFSKVFTIMGNHYWSGNNFFFGEYISAKNVDWSYIPVWIGITTPFTFLIMWFTGCLKYLITHYKNWNPINNFNSFMFFGFVTPVVVVVVLKSTLYDGWRHMFFIYPFLAYFMSTGFLYFAEIIQKIIKLEKYIIMLLLGVIVFSDPLLSIIKMHSHQQVYFNVFAGKDPMLNFEGDYWGLSYRAGLEWVLKNDDREEITIICPNGSWNRHILNAQERKRLLFKNYNQLGNLSVSVGDYYITNFRGNQPDEYRKATNKEFPFNHEVFSVNTRGMKILGVYRLH